MQFYRWSSWLYAIVSSLAIPLLVLDLCVDWPGLTAVWAALFALSVPLLVIQSLGLRRVLRERAPEPRLSGLVTAFWLLQLSCLLWLALMIGQWLAGEHIWALGTLLIGALPIFGVVVGLAVVKLLLGSRLGPQYPSDLFGLRRALSISFILYGALEIADLVIVISVPAYLVVGLALIWLVAFVIEGHARRPEPRFGSAPGWISYGLALVVGLGVPLASAPLWADDLSAQLEGWWEQLDERFGRDDDEDESFYEEDEDDSEAGVEADEPQVSHD